MTLPPLFQFPRLSAIPSVAHGISMRSGGVSEGRWESLNTSYTVGDDPARVDENLRRLAETLGTTRESLFWAHQVHGNTATVVAAGTPARPRCDILITRSPARTLLLRYADCTPVLLVDPVQKAVGLVHAGWRGSALGAASAGVQAMQAAFGTNPRDLVAGIGPAIGPCCYEVGPDVVEAFAEQPWAIVQPVAGKPRIDLWASNQRALERAGVPAAQIDSADICTRCHGETYFSHRGNNGQPAGRFAATIRLAA